MLLTPESIEEFRIELERQATRLERSLSLSEEATKPVQLDQQAVGRLSRIDSLQNQHMSRNLQERQEGEYAATRAALKRIEEGRYGVCTGCGGDIDPGRLFVMPATELCGVCGGGRPPAD